MKKLLLNFLTILVSVILTLMITEIGFRFFYVETKFNIFRKCDENLNDDFVKSMAFSQANAFYKPNDSIHHCGAEWDYIYHIDSNGFRSSSEDVSGSSILAIGDSFTFGFGVKDNESFPALLKAYNAGLWGNPFDIQQKSFTRNIKLKHPKIILWGIYPSHIVTMMPNGWSSNCPGDSNYFYGDSTYYILMRTLTRKIILPIWNFSSIAKYIKNKGHISNIVVGHNAVNVCMDCYSTKEIILYDNNISNNNYTSDPAINKSFPKDLNGVYHKLETIFNEAKLLSDQYKAKIYFLIIPSRLYLNIKRGSYQSNHKESAIDADLPLKTISKLIFNAGFTEENIIDLGKYFLAEKDWTRYYYKIDAHWNNTGHEFVYKVLKYHLINSNLPGIS